MQKLFSTFIQDAYRSYCTKRFVFAVLGVAFFNFLSVYWDMLLGSANLIKNCIGTFGIIMIILICFVPYMKLQIYSASIQIFTAIIQPVADRRIIESLNCLCNGIRLLIRVVISSGFLFVISIAIICMTTNVKT